MLKQYIITVIEPSPVIREGLKVLLEQKPEFTVRHSCRDLQDFQGMNDLKEIDIILMNPALVSFYKQFSVKGLFADFPDAAIVAVTYSYVDADILNSFDGVVDIYDDGQVIFKKLHRIIQQSDGKRRDGTEESIGLSDREKEILVSVASGLTNKEIADKHFISIHTVISHRKNITKKTGIKTVSGLTLYAMFNNLLPQDDMLG